MAPQSPGERSLSYKFVHCLPCPSIRTVLVFWEVCIRFSGGEGGRISAGGTLHGREFFHGQEIFSGWAFEGKLYTGEVCQNSYTKFLYVSCFSFTDSILWVELIRVIVRDKFSQGIVQRIFPRKGGFSVEFEPDFLALFQKQSKIKLKIINFFNWKKGTILNL